MKIIAINGSPKKTGNTATLVEWFSEGAREGGAQVDVVHFQEKSYNVREYGKKRSHWEEL